MQLSVMFIQTETFDMQRSAVPGCSGKRERERERGRDRQSDRQTDK